jgi:hypothetical protein
MSLFGPDMTDDFVKFNNFRVSYMSKKKLFKDKAANACLFF